MHVSNLSDFISDVTSYNTLLLIPIEFGTVFELGVQRLETLQEIDYNIRRHSRSRSEKQFRRIGY